jgi:hypothetical protein
MMELEVSGMMHQFVGMMTGDGEKDDVFEQVKQNSKMFLFHLTHSDHPSA